MRVLTHNKFGKVWSSRYFGSANLEINMALNSTMKTIEACRKMPKNTDRTTFQLQIQRSFFFLLRKRMSQLIATAYLRVLEFLFCEKIPRKLEKIVELEVFTTISKTIKNKQMLQCGKQNSHIVFCIVHWNSPDFLLLNVGQLELLYPDCAIFVLDNGSTEQDLNEVRKNLKQFSNLTLFLVALKPWNPVKIFGFDKLFNSYSHSKGLQFLLNYSAKQKIEIAVFLDQDCILNRKIDPLIEELNNVIWLVGARDYVLIPRNYGPLKKGKLRSARNLVHASFMLLKPIKIRQQFGDLALIEDYSIIKSSQHEYFRPEPYHGISIRTAGHILFLETQMHDAHPLLTSYSDHGIIYAWHAWYSSRTFGLSLSKQKLDELFPVPWLLDARKESIEFMKRIHEETSLDQRNA